MHNIVYRKSQSILKFQSTQETYLKKPTDIHFENLCHIISEGKNPSPLTTIEPLHGLSIWSEVDGSNQLSYIVPNCLIGKFWSLSSGKASCDSHSPNLHYSLILVEFLQKFARAFFRVSVEHGASHSHSNKSLMKSKTEMTANIQESKPNHTNAFYWTISSAPPR